MASPHHHPHPHPTTTTSSTTTSTSTSTSSGHIDIIEDEPSMYYLRHKKHIPHLSQAQKVAVYQRCRKFTFDPATNTLFYTPDPSIKLIVPPTIDRLQIIRHAHDGFNHQGFHTTLARVRSKFYWKGFSKEIREYIRSCPHCKRSKVAVQPPPQNSNNHAKNSIVSNSSSNPGGGAKTPHAHPTDSSSVLIKSTGSSASNSNNIHTGNVSSKPVSPNSSRSPPHHISQHPAAAAPPLSQSYFATQHPPPQPNHKAITGHLAGSNATGLFKPFQRVSVDILGPFPVTARQNRYVIIATDHFSGWMEAAPISNISSQEIGSFIYIEIICRYGLLKQVISEKEADIVSQAISFIERDIVFLFQKTHIQERTHCELIGGSDDNGTRVIPQVLKATDTLPSTRAVLDQLLAESFNSSMESSAWDLHIPSFLFQARMKRSEAGWTPWEALYRVRMHTSRTATQPEHVYAHPQQMYHPAHFLPEYTQQPQSAEAFQFSQPSQPVSLPLPPANGTTSPYRNKATSASPYHQAAPYPPHSSSEMIQLPPLQHGQPQQQQSAAAGTMEMPTTSASQIPSLKYYAGKPSSFGSNDEYRQQSQHEHKRRRSDASANSLNSEKSEQASKRSKLDDLDSLRPSNHTTTTLTPKPTPIPSPTSTRVSVYPSTNISAASSSSNLKALDYQDHQLRHPTSSSSVPPPNVSADQDHYSPSDAVLPVGLSMGYLNNSAVATTASNFQAIEPSSTSSALGLGFTFSGSFAGTDESSMGSTHHGAKMSGVRMENHGDMHMNMHGAGNGGDEVNCLIT